MSLLFGERRSINPRDLFVRGYDPTDAAYAGEAVNFKTVTGLDAVAAVVGLLSDVVMMLPVDVFRDRAGTGDPLVATPPIVANPSGTVSARVWRAQAMVSWLLWGNAYGLVVARDALERPLIVEWLDPTTVTIEEPSVLAPARYRVDGREVAPVNLLHAPGRYVQPGSRVGIAPLERFKETFGLALAARRFGSRWFGDGGHPSAILQSDQPINENQATTIKERFLAATRIRRGPAVLGAGLTYTPIQANPAESQMTTTSQESVVAVARAFGIAPEMIAGAVSGSSVTYANREQRAIDFLTFSVDPWLVRFEDLWIKEGINRMLNSPQYAKFNRGALLRTDLITRYRAHDSAIRAGWLSRNEARSLEDRAPIADGDEYLWPPYRGFPVAADEE